MQFSELNLTPNLLKSIDDIGFTSCTDVQEQTLAHTLAGKDVFVQSQTGTGKTAAFLISIFELFERSEFRERALIIVPTRELATQIEAEARQLSVHLNYSFVSVYGGVGYDKQERAIENDVDIIIGTPGRLVDLCKKKVLNLNKFTFAVLDEADRMLDMGFVKDIRFLIRSMASREIRQTMLFSATLDYTIKKLAEDFMNVPEEVAIHPETMTVDKINQVLYHVGQPDKMKLLIGLIESKKAEHIIIFSNMKRACEEIAGRLNYNGYKAEFLTGDLPQAKRQKCVDRFKRQEFPILVATDVAARGIHINDLDMVVNYDLPQHTENYVHRIGRTARAGKSGTAISLACEMFVEYLEPIQELIGMKIPSIVAGSEDFGDDKSTRYNWKKSGSGSSSRSGGKGGKSYSKKTPSNGDRKRASSSSKSYTQRTMTKKSDTSKDRKIWDPNAPILIVAEENDTKSSSNAPKKRKRRNNRGEHRSDSNSQNRNSHNKNSSRKNGPKQGAKNSPKKRVNKSNNSSPKKAAPKKSILSKVTSIFKR
jgi:ATP-dependent RNA helicase RhlB